MMRKKLIFGISIIGVFVSLFTIGLWIGGVPKGETQCLPIKLSRCECNNFSVFGPDCVAPWPFAPEAQCVPSCGSGYVLASWAETYFLILPPTRMSVGICMGI